MLVCQLRVDSRGQDKFVNFILISFYHGIGTCLETPPQHAEGYDEPVTISFFYDVSVNPKINELFNAIVGNMQKILSTLNKFLGQRKQS